MAAMSDLDGFSTKLNAILQADLTQAAMAAGPLEVPALANFNSMWTALGGESAAAAAAAVSPEVDSLLRNLRQQQEQVALLDRMQNIRVKNIQDEYQRFMERVRAKAQSAIDQANSAYSQQRAGLIGNLEKLIAYVTQHQQVAMQQAQQRAALVAAAGNVVGKQPDGGSGGAVSGGNGGSGANPINMLSQNMASQLVALTQVGFVLFY